MTHSVLLIAVMAAVTILLRFLPFLVFRKKTPKYVAYLGKVLPPAVIGMLVIYCLKDISPLTAPFGIPALIAAAVVVGLQIWKRNSLLSILAGTAVYMLITKLIDFYF
jgi:branched-subunit amino acid transport protein AzlD